MEKEAGRELEWNTKAEQGCPEVKPPVTKRVDMEPRTENRRPELLLIRGRPDNEGRGKPCNHDAGEPD